MRLLTHLIISMSFVSLSACGDRSDPAPANATHTRPNILLIVADDLGYSDIGSYGGEINTPALDQLAFEGVRFSNFHVLPTCSPTRSALMSGNDNHVAGFGVMGEVSYPAIANLPGYEGYLSPQVAAIPEILRDVGYHSYMAGKWHLGREDDHSPYARGFDRTFTMMNGGGSHWADMRPLSPIREMVYRRNGERLTELPEDFYSTRDYTDSLIEFIDGNKEDGEPFFAYLSFTAPHDPLHAPAEYIAKYQGLYDSGWDVLAARRLARLQQLGLVPDDVAELPANLVRSAWADLTAEQQREHARDMEVYAAMVDYMDMSIGRLIEFLHENDLYDNTLIIFISDNGANGLPAAVYPGNADGTYLATFDNSIENRGLPNSFINTGSGWAQASSAPFRMFKSFTSQGGIKSPMIIKAPGESIAAGGWNHSLLHVTDIMPTFLEIADASYPADDGGRALKQPIGRSIMPILNGNATSVRRNEGIGYELFEMKAYISGDWKILRMPAPFGSGDWALYNLREDPGEIHDLSVEYPERKADLIDAWQSYAEQNGVVDHNGLFDAAYRKAFGGGDSP